MLLMSYLQLTPRAMLSPQRTKTAAQKFCADVTSFATDLWQIYLLTKLKAIKYGGTVSCLSFF